MADQAGRADSGIVDCHDGPARSVFISHATNLEPREQLNGDASWQRRQTARRVLESAIAAMRDEAGLRPWYDEEDLRHGAFWRQEIHEALFSCVAGVVLLDADAFASPWVLKETIVLMVRKSLSPAFPVVIVLLDGLNVGSVEDHPYWRPLRIQEVHMLKLGADPDTDEVAKLSSEIAGAVSRADAAPPATRFELWVDAVFASLKGLAELTATLNAVSDRLGLDTADWLANGQSAVRSLARAMLTTDDHRCLPEILGSLPISLADERLALADNLRPLWVPPQRAVVMAAAVRRDPAMRTVILGTRDQDAAFDHVTRAECRSRQVWITATVDAEGEDPDGSRLTHACKDAVRATFPPAKHNDPSAYETYMKTYGSDTTVVLVLRSEALSVEVLRNVISEMHETFYGITVLLLDDDPEGLLQDLASDAATLVTPIPQDDERNVRAQHYDFLDAFAKGR